MTDDERELARRYEADLLRSVEPPPDYCPVCGSDLEEAFAAMTGDVGVYCGNDPNHYHYLRR